MTQRAIDGPYIYFVTTNTTFGRPLFDSPDRARLFGKIIRANCKEFDFILYGYCVLPNHVHLLVRKNGTFTLSKLMNITKGRLSRMINQGRFWQPRFNFRIIDNEERFVQTVEYIRGNFIKAELPDTYGQDPWVWIDCEAIQAVWE